MTDLNLTYGTCADGGSTSGWEFANPTRANDGDDATYAHSKNDVYSGPGTLLRRLKSDLASARIVRSAQVVYVGTFDYFDTLESSTDGSSWSATGAIPAAPYVVVGGGVVQDWAFPADITARYWRLSSSRTFGSGFHYVAQIDAATWVLESGTPPQAGVWADWDDDGFASADGDNITADVASWRITRGASAEVTGAAQTGSCTVVLNNPDTDIYNPLNAGGDLYGKLRDGVPFWIGLASDYTLDGNSVYGLFGGRIADVTPIPTGGLGRAAQVEITCEDELARLGRTPVTIEIGLDRTQGELREEILTAAGLTSWDLAHETATIPISSVDTNALGALEDLNKANGSRHFVRPGSTYSPHYLYTTRNRSWRLDATVDASLDAGTDHLTDTNGWRLSADTVINQQKVTITPIRFTLRSQTIWEDRDVPYTVKAGKPKTIWVEFDDFTKAASLDLVKTGSSLTSTLTNFGTTAKIVLTSSGTTVVTALSIEGQMVRRGNDQSAVADDTTSQAGPRGVRAGSDLASPYTGVLANAQGLAGHMVWRYGDSQFRPSLTVVNWLPEQLSVDLYDTIAVTIAQLGMTDRIFEVVGLTHECSFLASSTEYLFSTTYVLQESKVQADPGWFTLGSSTLNGSHILGY